jgi:hypothetical protein
MPTRPTEQGFRALNLPARVHDTGAHERTQLAKNLCPNHEYRSRTKRMGQAAKYGALCMDQREMAERWKNIRKALVTIRCSTRKSSAPAKPRMAFPADKDRQVSVSAAVVTIAVPEEIHVVVVVNFG